MKNMLKGIRRLAIATLTVCGVSLFLFGSEVKADDPLVYPPTRKVNDETKVTISSDGTEPSGFKITIAPEVSVEITSYNQDTGEALSPTTTDTFKDDILVESVTVISGSDSWQLSFDSPVTIPVKSDGSFDSEDVSVSASDYLKHLNGLGTDIASLLNSDKKTTVTATVKYKSVTPTGITSEDHIDEKSLPSEGMVNSAAIYKIDSSVEYATVESSNGYKPKQTESSKSKITISDASGTQIVGKEGCPVYAYSGMKYSISSPLGSDYSNYYMATDVLGTTSYFDARWKEGASEIASGTVSSDYTCKVAFLPKISAVKITTPANNEEIKLEIGTGTKTAKKDLEVVARIIPASGESNVEDSYIVAEYASDYSIDNKTTSGNKYTNYWRVMNIKDRNVDKKFTITIDSFEKAAIDPEGYILSAVVDAGVLHDNRLDGKFTNPSANNNLIRFKVDDTPDPDPTKSEVDPDKTIEAFKKGKNYITASNSSNSTKFELDLNKAFVLLDKDGKEVTGRTITWSKTSGDADLSSDGKLSGSKYSEVKLQAVVKKGDVEEITIKDIPVTVYPMPEVKYTSGKGSSRKLDVSVPAKISTGDISENIDNVSGFKLELADSNGNVLYSYDDGKYATVVKDASVSDGVKKYSVSYSDIEAMVTSAASNGKFSADSTPVYFKVTPIGYKTGASSTSRANDKIFGKSDNTNVYKVTATGENIVASTAYGLEGQEIKLTATPVTGYTFSKWSDGNTSPTKTVTVSASTGSNVYRATAVLGTRQDGTLNPDGTAGTGGYDDVPKTAESNAPIWIILIMVFAFIGGGYALFLQIRPQEENR